jgi:hypothetical protein
LALQSPRASGVTFQFPRPTIKQLASFVTPTSSKKLENFLEEVGVTKEASCLIVGLGNWNVTPDALGPIVVEFLLKFCILLTYTLNFKR